MIRIFLPPDQLKSNEIVITGDNAKHLVLVLRVRPGEPITIFDGQGYKYECTVTQVYKKEVTAAVNNKSPYSVESPVSISLVQGIAKGHKMDFIIQKSIELGVNRIIPVFTERSEVRHTHKIDRWSKIALSASQQSGRDRIPEISPPARLEEYLSSQITPSARGYVEDIKGVKQDPAISIILSERHNERNLKKVLSSVKDTRHITILVGPEGGFSKEEIDTAVDKGFIEVSLGPRILRTETAPISAISIVQYELGDVG